MRLDFPEWTVARDAAKKLNCTPEQFVAFAVTQIGAMLVDKTRDTEAIARAMRSVMAEPDIFADMRKPKPKPKRGRRSKPSFKDSEVAMEAKGLRSDRVYRAKEQKSAGLTHNPFQEIKLDE